MSHWEQCAIAQKRWAHRLSQEEGLALRWSGLLAGLLGDSKSQHAAVEEIASLSLWDAPCSMLSAAENKPLRLMAGLRASDRLATVLSLSSLAHRAPPGHVLQALQRNRLLESFLLQTATKAQPGALSETAREELLGISRRMVTISAGDYWIGGKNHSERPVHRILLPSYQIGVFPVTQLLWSSVQRKNPSKYKGASRPVECVAWWDALRFCNDLSERDGLEPSYQIVRGERARPLPGNGYRLPSEAEWEVASRAGLPGRRILPPEETLAPPLGSTYSGGDDLSALGWCMQNTGTRPIGQKGPNGNGIFDLSGNVFEWVWDWFGPYSQLIQEKTRRRGELLYPYFQRRNDAVLGPSTGRYRSYRGGSWSTSLDYARTASRMANVPTLRSPCVGFRLARSIDPA
jgi:formylglycine-generating enzyme